MSVMKAEQRGIIKGKGGGRVLKKVLKLGA